MLIASQLLFDFIVPNIVTKHIGKGTKKLEKLTETFEYETTRSDFKCCDYQENWKTIWYVRLQLGIPRTQEAFSDKVAPDIDGFRNEPVVQCDAQVVKSTFVDYSKWMKKW